MFPPVLESNVVTLHTGVFTSPLKAAFCPSTCVILADVPIKEFP